jgi:ATP-dependent exoDNAse (exonuclease V) alpha subunit
VLAECKALPPEIIETELSFLQGALITQKGLSLKVGCQVMLTFNMNMDLELVNGSLGIVEGFVTVNGSIVPEVRFYNGVKTLVKMHYWQSEKIPTIVVGNIPLQLSWAVTVHKIQGATLDMAEMDLGKNVFECGQSYVALSRVRSLDGLFLVDFDPVKIRANPIVVEFYRNKFPKEEDHQEEETTPVEDENETFAEEDTEVVNMEEEFQQEEDNQKEDQKEDNQEEDNQEENKDDQENVETY